MENSREYRYNYFSEVGPVSTAGSSNCCYATPFSNNAFHHSYYANNFPMFHHGYHQENIHQHQSMHSQKQEMRRARPRNYFYNRMPLIETRIPGSRVQNHVERFQFSDGNQPSSHCWQPSFRSSHDVRNLSFYHYHSHSEHPSADIIPSLALPDLNHDTYGSIPIISPKTENSVLPDRVSYKGRFNPGKPPSLTLQSSSSPSTELRANDIVCGRGAPTLFHEGNKKFRELILQYQSTYLFSKRPDKPRVAWNLLEIVTSNGGRFVRRVKGNRSNSRDEGVRSSCHGWEPLNERQAYDKICQSLREGAPELKRRILLRAATEIQSQGAAEK